EPHLALRRLDAFIVDELSNWYIRRSRRRFWGAGTASEAAAAFATLHEVLHATVRLIAPVAPFLADALWRRLAPSEGSVHCARLPEFAPGVTTALESALAPILAAAKLGRARREKVGIRTRQPLARVTICLPQLGSLGAAAGQPSPGDFERELKEELNVKEVRWVDDPAAAGLVVAVKPHFPTLGPKAGPRMKAVAAAVAAMSCAEAMAIQRGEARTVEGVALAPEDVVVAYQAAAGQEAESDGFVTLVLDTQLTPALEREGLAREVLNRVQTQRKESEFAVGDRIELRVVAADEVLAALQEHGAWIAEEALAPAGLLLSESLGADARIWELPGARSVQIAVTRI
ncbi:MAG: DUF5915 domain-containing protein, partial [Chloroflexota bacterium]